MYSRLHCTGCRRKTDDAKTPAIGPHLRTRSIRTKLSDDVDDDDDDDDDDGVAREESSSPVCRLRECSLFVVILPGCRDPAANTGIKPGPVKLLASLACL